MEPPRLSKIPEETRPPLALVTALPEELAVLHRRAKASRNGRPFSLGMLGGRRVVLACGGDGAAKSARGVAALLSEHPAHLLIGAGVAGGLSEDLRRGDVVVGLRVLDAEGEAPTPDDRWVKRALAVGAKGAVLMTERQILTTSAAKARALAKVPKGTTAAIDTESASWSREAARRGVPCLVLRCISDAAEDELPQWLETCLDGEGGVNRVRVLREAVRHPRDIPSLLNLRRSVRDAVDRLADFLEGLLNSAA